MVDPFRIQTFQKILSEFIKLFGKFHKDDHKMAADRGAFIDQSQSMNIHIADPSYSKLTSMHFTDGVSV